MPPFPLPSSPTTLRSSVLRSVFVCPFPPPKSKLASCSDNFCWYDTLGACLCSLSGLGEEVDEVEDECEWPLRWSPFLRGRPPSPVDDPGVGAGRVGVPAALEVNDLEMSSPAGFLREMPDALPMEPGGGPPGAAEVDDDPPAGLDDDDDRRRELDEEEVRSRVLPEDDDDAVEEVGGRGEGRRGAPS